MYFCGQNPECVKFNSPWALAKAKQNVEQLYPVVGVLEMLEDSIRLLEEKVPFVVKGLSNFLRG